MDERAALAMLEGTVADAGDDAAVVDGLVITTDMLHERTDFPEGTTRYTAGWRSVGASLSDVAAMGAEATAAVAVYGAPEFDERELTEFVLGAGEVCESVGGRYVGGDLDGHEEFTVATTAVGKTNSPVRRSGAQVGDAICVTGVLGRSAAGFRCFQAGAHERGNELFQFPPRVAAGQALADHATAMMDSSDGLARSLHQLAEASGCGAEIASADLPVHEAVEDLAEDERDRLEMATFFGEDFELVCTIPEDDLAAAQAACPVDLTAVGSIVEDGVRMDDEPLPDRGFTHGDD